MEGPPSQPPDFGEYGRKLRGAQGPDRTILIAGVLFFIDSFLPWYGVRIGRFSATASGWDSGGLAVLAILFAIGAVIWSAINVVGARMNIDAKTSGGIYLILSGGAFVFSLLRLITANDFTKYGLYFAIILGAFMGFAAYRRFQATAT
jgi:hypothetical protein